MRGKMSKVGLFGLAPGLFVESLGVALRAPAYDSTAWEMYRAVIRNSPEEVTRLLDAGADPNLELSSRRLHDGDTALSFSVKEWNVQDRDAQRRDYTTNKVAKVLLDRGADVNHADSKGETALLNAVYSVPRALDANPGDDPEFVKMLLGHGAKVDSRLLGHGTYPNKSRRDHGCLQWAAPRFFDKDITPRTQAMLLNHLKPEDTDEFVNGWAASLVENPATKEGGSVFVNGKWQYYDGRVWFIKQMHADTLALAASCKALNAIYKNEHRYKAAQNAAGAAAKGLLQLPKGPLEHIFDCLCPAKSRGIYEQLRQRHREHREARKAEIELLWAKRRHRRVFSKCLLHFQS